MMGRARSITTEQCLLNPTRNPELSAMTVEQRLHRDLGLERVIWLGSGLLTITRTAYATISARFIAPGRVAIPSPAKDDPNERFIAMRAATPQSGL